MDESSVKEIARLSAQAGSVRIIPVIETSIRQEGIPFAAVPKPDGAMELKGLKAEFDLWRTAPERITGTAKVGTLISFVDLVNRHKNDGSALFGAINTPSPSFTAVIDYHSLDHAPRFGKHRIVYDFPVSPEWQAWQAFNAKPMSQGEWAAFVEEHIADLSAPYDAERSEYERLFQTTIAVPSDLIQLSRGMQIAVESRVKDIRVLQSGEAEILYEEVHKDSTGNKLIVPGLFVINIPLFVGGETTRIITRLRYRRQDSRIVWFYQLYRADLVVRMRLQSDFEAVGDQTGLPIFEGSPEA